VSRPGLPGAIVVLVLAAGCSAPRAQTTFLDDVDLVDMTDRMASSFSADEVIGERTPGSDPWVVSIDRVRNFTNQIMPAGEKWLYVARLRTLLARSPVTAQRNITWVVEPERWPATSAALEPGPAGPRLRPTHLLAGEFSTLTVTSGAGRSDTYVCAFALTEIDTGRLVWTDAWEMKRATRGVSYD